MYTKIYRVYGWKTEPESTNWELDALYNELIGKGAFSFCIRFTDK